MNYEFPQGTIHVDGEAVEITWEDGRVQKFRASFLRAGCPCATCRNAKFDVEESMFPGIQVEKLNLVGAYAIQFEYSDGHSTGAYPYQKLKIIFSEPGSPRHAEEAKASRLAYPEEHAD